ncbi:MAG TPA: NAD(P)-dependent oxidoreductase, partial [Puia sp.]|nr:NAD(P)-dependent oxidoreductase [Puia sp.]
MRQKILITRSLFPDIVERLRGYFDVAVNEGAKYTAEQLKEALRDKSGVLIAGGEKVNAELLEGLSNLRAVCVSAAGYNNVDVPALTRAGVIGTNSPGPADETVADFTWGSLISIARKIGESERWVLDGQWKGTAGSRFFGTEVHGKTIGIIGMGRIGQAIARRAAGVGVKVLYYNRRRLDASSEQECRASYRTKSELLANADFVILSLPYAPGNYHIIGAPELEL